MAEVHRMIATHDYIGKNAEELTFNKGDTIMVPKPSLAGKDSMIKGVCKGKVGLFPRIYVDDTTVEHKDGVATRVRAIGNYTAAEEGELSFDKNDVMFVAKRASATHWQGVHKGKVGTIPCRMVVDASEKKVDTSVQSIRCMAVKTYVDENPAHLSFKIGGIVHVPVADDSLAEWKGVHDSVVGTFPKEYVVDTAKVDKAEIDKIIAKNSEDAEEKANVAKFEAVMEKRKAARSS
eukprot:m.60076 g.60076  ORF g.60076 m.60076 type:complete len:235 (-) comp15734_c0_seq1:326-1030(-)